MSGALLTLGDLGSYELFITWGGGVDSTPSKIAKNAPMRLKIGRMMYNKNLKKAEIYIIGLTSIFRPLDLKNADFRDAATKVCPLRKS